MPLSEGFPPPPALQLLLRHNVDVLCGEQVGDDVSKMGRHVLESGGPFLDTKATDNAAQDRQKKEGEGDISLTSTNCKPPSAYGSEKCECKQDNALTPVPYTHSLSACLSL